jgi:hypothetical protein
VRSRQLDTALTDFIAEAAHRLGADTAQGAEVPFEIVAQGSRFHRTPLYCYRPLTADFISERAEQLSRLPAHGPAARLLSEVDGLDRYLAARGAASVPADSGRLAEAALQALLDDVFEGQSQFELRTDRVQDAFARLEDAAAGHGTALTVVASLHGLALGSPELHLTSGLLLAQPDALRGIPPEAVAGVDQSESHLLAVFTSDEADARDAAAASGSVLRNLLRALRLFGDARISLGALAWSRLGTGSWRPVVLGGGGRARGVLVVTPEQEDELRAFCNLVWRRAPSHGELAWALERYEMGCDRVSEHQALSDYLLALRALLEPEGPSTGLLSVRLAALCAEPEHRAALAERLSRAVELEYAIIAGGEAPAGDEALVRGIGDHLRALLRDVICGHLDSDLYRVADELLAAPPEPEVYPEPGELPGEEQVPGVIVEEPASEPNPADAEAPEAGSRDPTRAGYWADIDQQGMLPF